MTCAEIIAVAKDVIVATASVVAAGVAFYGVNTWRRQSWYARNQELGRRILISLYRYRDALQGVRSPFMAGSEMVPDTIEGEGKSDGEEIRHRGLRNAYSRRWKRVDESRNELHADLIEAEAIWGRDLKNQFGRIFELQGTLLANLSLWLNQTDPEKDWGSHPDKEKVVRAAEQYVYDEGLDDKPSEFTQQLNQVVQDLEAEVKKKMQA